MSESTHTPTIALVGNPNTGKSTIYNALTGQRQRVGNYSGVTVKHSVSPCEIEGQQINLIDLPGTYSLSVTSLDEQVVLDYLCGKIANENKPEVVVCVVDAANLQRNLQLASQVADIGVPLVIALNQMDVASRLGVSIDAEKLSERLGVPVVPCVATRKKGLDDLKQSLTAALKDKPHMVQPHWPESVNNATKLIKERAPEKAQLTDDFRARRLLFDGNTLLARHLEWDEVECKVAIGDAHKILQDDGLNPTSAESVLRQRHLTKVLADVITQSGQIGAGRTESIDRILTHKFWGMIAFIALMYVVFQAVYAWAVPLMDLIDAGTGWAQDAIAPLLESMPTLQSLVVDGIIGGVGGVIIFLPQILILFFFIGLLEDTGYMARAAYLMDRILGWCGLNGRSFVPLMSSYACAIPGVMAARTIADPKARLTTILIAPLMSCSARLPVYVIFIGAFVEPVYGAARAGQALFAMHFVGLLVSVPVAWAINRFILKARRQPFIMEMSLYRTPQLKPLFWRVMEAGREFLVRAGSIILCLSIIIWATLYFPRSEEVAQSVRDSYIERVAQEQNVSEQVVAGWLDEEDSEHAETLQLRTDAAYIEQSYLGRFGKTIQPVFEPAGFDWKITVGVVSSFPAREVIISTMGIIYSLGGDVDEESEALRETMANAVWEEGPRKGQPVYTLPVVFAIMVFFALCMQCGATLAIIAQETAWKWAIFCFVYMTGLAWLGAVLTYQIGTHFFT